VHTITQAGQSLLITSVPQIAFCSGTSIGPLQPGTLWRMQRPTIFRYTSALLTIQKRFWEALCDLLRGAGGIADSKLTDHRLWPHCLKLALHETMHTHAQDRVARLFIEKSGPANGQL